MRKYRVSGHAHHQPDDQTAVSPDIGLRSLSLERTYCVGHSRQRLDSNRRYRGVAQILRPDSSCNYEFVRFSPGNPVVGGLIKIATITEREGFRWVRRKRFFDARWDSPYEGA